MMAFSCTIGMVTCTSKQLGMISKFINLAIYNLIAQFSIGKVEVVLSLDGTVRGALIKYVTTTTRFEPVFKKWLSW